MRSPARTLVRSQYPSIQGLRYFVCGSTRDLLKSQSSEPVLSFSRRTRFAAPCAPPGGREVEQLESSAIVPRPRTPLSISRRANSCLEGSPLEGRSDLPLRVFILTGREAGFSRIGKTDSASAISPFLAPPLTDYLKRITFSLATPHAALSLLARGLQTFGLRWRAIPQFVIVRECLRAGTTPY